MSYSATIFIRNNYSTKRESVLLDCKRHKYATVLSATLHCQGPFSSTRLSPQSSTFLLALLRLVMREQISPFAFPRVVVLLFAMRFRYCETLDITTGTASIEYDMSASLERWHNQSRPSCFACRPLTSLENEVAVGVPLFTHA